MPDGGGGGSSEGSRASSLEEGRGFAGLTQAGLGPVWWLHKLDWSLPPRSPGQGEILRRLPAAQHRWSCDKDMTPHDGNWEALSRKGVYLVKKLTNSGKSSS
uniref:Uncharacterized protein n=1 Tax=Oryza punctata TaxID=4537 RepID=A0A0E0JMP4_ORYPU